jgi:hypothetical protein
VTRYSGRGNEFLVVLMLALELQEVVVAALFAIWIAAADIRTGVIYGAPALIGVEEAADGFIDVIALMTQDLLVDFFGLISIREPAPGFFKRYLEVLCEASDVVVTHSNTRMTAAIARAREAVVTRFHNRAT